METLLANTGRQPPYLLVGWAMVERERPDLTAAFLADGVPPGTPILFTTQANGAVTAEPYLEPQTNA